MAKRFRLAATALLFVVSMVAAQDLKHVRWTVCPTGRVRYRGAVWFHFDTESQK
ncbi:MAG TPA: hypothetical protein VLI39_18930 [Sedimentisphaerales bacterium]|nr:hypothetical protein [Sedimentisphaerales bacterium]